MTTSFSLPFGNSLQPETGEMQRTRIFCADGMYHVRLVFRLFQTHPDILAVQGAQYRILFVIELLSREHALVTCKGNRFGEVCAVDIVDGAPRTVYPVGTCLQDVMLEIVLIIEKNLLARCLMGKLVQSAPIPAIGLCEVIA